MADKYKIKNVAKIIFSYISFVYFLGMVAFLVYSTIHNTVDQPKQEKILKELKAEFNSINKLPNDKVAYEKYIAYTDKTSVSIDYSTDLQDDEVQVFYSNELKRNGWKLIDQHKVYDWGRDLGGKSFTYRKSNLKLSIQYAGDRAGAGWAYGIYLGLNKL
ncbi:MAG: hypothetical protein EOP33_07870 [Rickettsiaceae bacterium]|nr:MAG: hypothetical protein EOP33_07870 [Rickettsiaceae bacterium]